MATKIIDQQMQAYNSRNIDKMMELFSDDIQIFDYNNNHSILNGIEECKNMFTNLFNSSPELYAEAINTIAFDNKVIVHEVISGRNGNNEKVEQVFIFEVKNKKINRINSIRGNP